MAIRRGTAGADALNGTAGGDWLFGRGGGDVIHGFGGEDALWGDAGDDVMWGDSDADFLSGGAGDDQLGGGGMNNVLHGDDGDDTLLYNPGAIELVPGFDYGGQHMEGGRGHDTLRLGTDAYFVGEDGARIPAEIFLQVDEDGSGYLFFTMNDTLFMRGGSFSGIEQLEFTTPLGTSIIDTRTGGVGGLHAIGDPGNDEDAFSFGPGTVARGAPPPVSQVPADEPPPPRDVWGTPRNDIIAGGDATERIFAGGGNDRVTAGDGDDLVYGGGGADRLLGEVGHDRIFGGPGNDSIEFGADGGEAHGGGGNDVMLFDPGAVDVSFFAFPGRFDGGEGFDTLRVVNRAVAGWADEPIRPARTEIDLNGLGSGSVNEPSLAIGVSGDDGVVGAHVRIFALERIEVTSDASRPVAYSGQGSSLPSMQLVSGDGNDGFSSGTIDEVLDGGRGNDFFRFGGGNDRFISRLDDADRFEVGSAAGTVRIQGFNGAGTAGGDTITITEPATVTRAGTTTVFDWGEGEAVVNAVGLVEGTDYYFA